MSTIICDIDGVLCENNRVKYSTKSPFKYHIDKLNKWYELGHRIELFTSRPSKGRKETEQWLEDNNVKHHKLIMDKPRGDIYIDDKGINSAKMGDLTLEI